MCQNRSIPTGVDNHMALYGKSIEDNAVQCQGYVFLAILETSDLRRNTSKVSGRFKGSITGRQFWGFS